MFYANELFLFLLIKIAEMYSEELCILFAESIIQYEKLSGNCIYEENKTADELFELFKESLE